MITHDEIRTALFTVLKADATVKSLVKKWYRLVVPETTISPFVAVTDISQPTAGVAGGSVRRTRRDNPMVVTVIVCTDKHDVDDADEDLGDAYIAVYDVLCESASLGISGLKQVGIDITTRPMKEYGKYNMGAEIHISYIYNNIGST